MTCPPVPPPARMALMKGTIYEEAGFTPPVW
jgi:hypothetical protein